MQKTINYNKLNIFLHCLALIRGQAVEWTNGRQLKKISCVCEEPETGEPLDEWIDIAEYTYDENGIKTSVKAEGKTTYFIYEGNTLLGQYTDNDGTIENAMQFLYDENGEIQGVQHNGRMYYYQKDIMGNVYTIRNASGNGICSYKYEAYGHNFFSYGSNDDFRNINPIKYRGYYYDSYYGGYYNLSRYYNPGMGRFLNLDDPMIALQSKSDPDGMNLYTYCNNDPVNKFDPTGYWGADVHNGYKSGFKHYRKIKGIYYGTYYWAIKSGFSEKRAKQLGKWCAKLDKDYPSTAYFFGFLKTRKWDRNKQKWQYYHFNMFTTSEREDSRINYANKWFEKAVKLWKNKNYDDSMKWLGYGLHCLQDIDAHGQIGAGSGLPQHIYTIYKNKTIDKADKIIGYEWNSRRDSLIYIKNSLNRLNSTASRTCAYLTKFMKRIRE